MLNATDIFSSNVNEDVTYEATQKHFKVRSATIPKLHLLFLKFRHETVATSGYWYKIKNMNTSSPSSDRNY